MFNFYYFISIKERKREHIVLFFSVFKGVNSLPSP